MKKPSDVAVVIFEGGRPHDPLEEVLLNIRREVVLDNIEKIKDVDGTPHVLLVTDHEDLAQRARAQGAAIRHADYRKRWEDSRYSSNAPKVKVQLDESY
jgi:hypothetical protein